MPKAKKIRLRATFNLVLENNVKVNDGDIFEIEREEGKKLMEQGLAQYPSKYVNRGLRMPKFSYEAVEKLTKELEEMIEKHKESK